MRLREVSVRDGRRKIGGGNLGDQGRGGEGDALLSRDLLISWSWLEEVSASLRSLPTVSTRPTLGTYCRYVLRHTRVSTGVSRAAASLTLGVAHRSRLSSTPPKVQSQRDKPRGTQYTMLPLLRRQCWLISTARVAPDASRMACGWLQSENRARKSPAQMALWRTLCTVYLLLHLRRIHLVHTPATLPKAEATTPKLFRRVISAVRNSRPGHASYSSGQTHDEDPNLGLHCRGERFDHPILPHRQPPLLGPERQLIKHPTRSQARQADGKHNTEYTDGRNPEFRCQFVHAQAHRLGTKKKLPSQSLVSNVVIYGPPDSISQAVPSLHMQSNRIGLDMSQLDSRPV